MSIIFNKVKNNSNKFPSKIAIVDGDKTITYSALIKQAELIAHFIRKKVNFNNLRIAICINEGMQLPIIVLALNLIKATIIPINHGLHIKQIQHLLASVDANAIITDDHKKMDSNDFNPDIVKINLTDLLDLKFKNDDFEPYFSLLNIDSLKNYDQFLITLSSGSTGNPKPIIFSEENKLARFDQTVKSYQIDDHDVVLCASPFYHSLGQRLTFLPLLSGGTLCILKIFTAKNWITTVKKNKVTFAIPVSSHLHEVIDPLMEKPFQFPSLRCLVSSSAAINDEVKRKLFEEMPCEFHEMYGASEVGTATSLNNSQAKLKPKSVGFPNIDVYIKIVNDQMMDCNRNTIGQIIVKSPLASSGYYGLSEITSESFKSGYFLTGDIGYLDDDGFLFFVDRKKDIIISGGINIYPSDIEVVLNETFGVKESYVLGIYDSFLGEIPVAVIISDAESKSLENLLRKNVRNKLSGYQRPIKYFFKDKVPLTSSGKVDKRVLRDELNSLKLNLSSKLLALYNSQGSN